MIIPISISLLLQFASTVIAYKEGTKQLLLVQSLWRHGDRSPTKTFKSDVYQEDSWKFGGGGWGQLSPIGMAQHLNLGKKLRQRYVNDFQFLPPVYDSKKIYVRSTDVNRTIISAFSNMMGMYGQDYGTAVAGVDYPDVLGWPRGYIPMAVHTVDDDTDHLADVDSPCPFQDRIWGLAKTSKEVSDFSNSPKVQQLLANLTLYCNETITIDNLWIVTQALFVEQLHKNDTLRKDNKWFSDDLYALADSVNDQVQLYQNGIFKTNPNIVQNIDVGVTLRKIRGGTMVNDMLNHMKLKIKCKNSQEAGCTWMNKLQYFVYSAHDTTLYAFFSALLVEQYAVKPAGYPLYSACILVELYQDTVDQKTYFKLLYHERDGADFTPITKGVDGCPQDSDFCGLDVFQKFADVTKPDYPMQQWCYQQNSSSQLFSIFTVFAVIYNFLF